METPSIAGNGIADLKLPFSLFLALRYLKPKRTFLSIITLISVIGVMLGVTVLILVIAVMTGFDRELRQKVSEYYKQQFMPQYADLLRQYYLSLAERDRKPPGDPNR